MKAIVINTGFLRIPVEDMFSDARPERKSTILYPIDQEKRCLCVIRSLLCRSGSMNILIDAGVGELIDQRILTHYDYRSEGDWNTLLKPHGLSPADITDVILTHLHFDHCGGVVQHLPCSIDPEEVILTFPKATHWVSSIQWEWAQNIVEREPDSFFEHTFLPIQTAGRLQLIENNTEILPGIQVRLFSGHTRGLMVPIIATENETIVFAGDLIPTSIHLDPNIGMSYDRDPELVREEKKGFLAEIKSHDWKLLFQHDPVSERREEKGERRKEK